MSQEPIEKLYPRSPRYVLQMNDQKVLRYASYPRGHRSFYTEIVNLSETGMAFTVPFLDTPHKNEIIMVEFTPPGSTQSIACYAQVQRIQKISIIDADLYQKNCKLVAVTFTSLKEPQIEQIRSVLAKKFKQMNRHFQWQQLKMKFLWNLKFKKKQIITYTLLTGATGLTFYSVFYFFFT